MPVVHGVMLKNRHASRGEARSMLKHYLKWSRMKAGTGMKGSGMKAGTGIKRPRIKSMKLPRVKSTVASTTSVETTATSTAATMMGPTSVMRVSWRYHEAK
jgi:hypothetical protein